MKNSCKIIPETAMRPNGSIGIEDIISFLKENSVMVEVGCYYGESTLMWQSSEKIIKIYAVDPWKDFYDINDGASQRGNMVEVERLFDENIKNSTKIIKIKSTSVDASKTFEDKSLDFVYLDGSHTYNDLCNDITHWLPKIKKDGIIAGHDITWITVKSAVEKYLGKNYRTFSDSSWASVVQ